MATIECEVLRSADTAAVVQLLAKAFSANEPPAVAVGLTSADFVSFLELLCPGAIDDGLTIVARDSASGQIAGVMLTDDFAVPSDLPPAAISDKFLPIMAMLDSLDERYRRGQPIIAGQYVHLFMLAVDERFAGQGIATQLVSTCLANSRRLGYTHAVTEATGIISQHVFRKLGFAERHRVCYQEYRYEGRKVFSSIRDHEAAILMDRTLA